uniref:Uncharacterized protein n=1 Tax=Panagrolaimus sp. ES5 TaxID=591445 RepID=A0AC34G927_9BILA
MILSKDVYDKCTAPYQKVIDEFEQKIADIKSQDGIDEENKYAQLKLVVDAFFESYYIPMEYWSHFYEHDLNNSKVFDDWGYSELYIYLRHKSLDFYEKPGYTSDFLEYIFVLNYGFLNFGEYFAEETEITFPHSHLVELFHFHERGLSSPPPKKVVERYEAMRLLYFKIKAVEDDVEQWFKLLLEVGIDDFVTHVT